MKKFSGILIIISLLVSMVDIIDTSDIMLGNKALFSSTNDTDQDEIDDLDLQGITSYSNILFNFTISTQQFSKYAESKLFYPQKSFDIVQDFPNTIDQPPIV